ncbi:single-stranded DNA-binding protein [Lewinellaceae bacterium SD302]|nr:single-stranded DNA-binding protein [Lewinellaceae bacterium SD302]
MQIRNNITLIGNVGKQPETVNTSTGKPMLRFSLATNEYWKDQDGNRQTRTEWHNIVAFGKQAELMKSMIGKGELLAVSGTLRYNKWVDKNDHKRVTAQIHVDGFELLTPKSQKEPVAA